MNGNLLSQTGLATNGHPLQTSVTELFDVVERTLDYASVLSARFAL